MVLKELATEYDIEPAIFDSGLNVTKVEAKKGHLYSLRLAFKIRKYDAYLVFNGGVQQAAASLIAKVLFKSRIRVYFWDTNLQNPGKNIKSTIKKTIKKLLFLSVDYFLVMHKYTLPYEKIYGISKSKIKYIPFKANVYDSLSRYNPLDHGYILSCGASHRDYGCLIEALKNTVLPLTIVMPDPSLASYHNTFLFDNSDLPSNIRIEYSDFDPFRWNKKIAESKFVVIPINKDSIQPAGISVYLSAMALGKAVVITEGASTIGLIDNERAVLVPPNDPIELRHAIEKLYFDDDLRERLAVSGRDYALSLQGNERLNREIFEFIIKTLSDK